MASKVGDESRQSWCSACFSLAEHRVVKGFRGPTKSYLCGACGAPTTACASPSCKHMSSRGTSSVTKPRYCAQHRHEIPGFEKLGAPIGAIDEWHDWLSVRVPQSVADHQSRRRCRPHRRRRHPCSVGGSARDRRCPRRHDRPERSGCHQPRTRHAGWWVGRGGRFRHGRRNRRRLRRGCRSRWGHRRHGDRGVRQLAIRRSRLQKLRDGDWHRRCWWRVDSSRTRTTAGGRGSG